MEHHPDLFGPEVPQGRGVARDALADPVGGALGHPLGPKPRPAFADPEAQPVSAAQIVVMACPARDIPVARQDLVIKQKPPQSRLPGIERDEIGVAQGRGKLRERGRGKKDEPMKQITAALLLALATPALAEIEEARDLMEAGKFEEARTALWPAARSGNADAEELIGVMYALGLGVERDPERAFEWYLRASMKGHPGAQSGIGWYYEVGLGMPAPDLVRAYLWYALSAIGGDPDAAISLEEVVKKMTPGEIERAQRLIDDYKPWMYPFR